MNMVVELERERSAARDVISREPMIHSELIR
jgi:hypothetical protein